MVQVRIITPMVCFLFLGLSFFSQPWQEGAFTDEALFPEYYGICIMPDPAHGIDNQTGAHVKGMNETLEELSQTISGEQPWGHTQEGTAEEESSANDVHYN